MPSCRFAPLVAVAQGTYTVMTFGDSWGDTGPTYKVIDDAFKKNNVAVDSKNRAVGGTQACQWASETKSRKNPKTTFKAGEALAVAAEEEFGEVGPDFVWYTLGGNDLAFDDAKASCLKKIPKYTDGLISDEAKNCMKTSSDKAMACTEQLFAPFFKKFPNSKLMQCNYDVPCESKLCHSVVDGSFMGGDYCGGNKYCDNQIGIYWGEVYVQQLRKKYSEPQYTGLDIFGTVQAANGVEGAAPGKPNLHEDSGDCGLTHEILCIHPAHGTKMATAIGDQFWEQFFSKHVAASNITSV